MRREGDVAHEWKHKQQRDVDGESVEIKRPVQARKEAHEEKVEQGNYPRDGDGKVRTHVADDGDLNRQPDVGRQEKADKPPGEGPSGRPLPQWVEEQLAAAVSVLFPARELIVDGEAEPLGERLGRRVVLGRRGGGAGVCDVA